MLIVENIAKSLWVSFWPKDQAYSTFFFLFCPDCGQSRIFVECKYFKPVLAESSGIFVEYRFFRSKNIE